MNRAKNVTFSFDDYYASLDDKQRNSFCKKVSLGYRDGENKTPEEIKSLVESSPQGAIHLSALVVTYKLYLLHIRSGAEKVEAEFGRLLYTLYNENRLQSVLPSLDE